MTSITEIKISQPTHTLGMLLKSLYSVSRRCVLSGKNIFLGIRRKLRVTYVESHEAWGSGSCICLFMLFLLLLYSAFITRQEAA